MHLTPTHSWFLHKYLPLPRWLANLGVLQIIEIKPVPYVSVSHPFDERLIGTIRREYIERAFFWNAGDPKRKRSNLTSITTRIAYTPRSMARYPRNVPVHPYPLLPRLVVSLAAVLPRSLPDTNCRLTDNSPVHVSSGFDLLQRGLRSCLDATASFAVQVESSFRGTAKRHS